MGSLGCPFFVKPISNQARAFLAAFLAGAFLAAAFLAGAFLAGAFLATAFLAGAFLATAFLAGAFFTDFGAFMVRSFCWSTTTAWSIHANNHEQIGNPLSCFIFQDVYLTFSLSIDRFLGYFTAWFFGTTAAPNGYAKPLGPWQCHGASVP